MVMSVSERDPNGLCLLLNARKMGEPSLEVRLKELFYRAIREQIHGFITSDYHLLEERTFLYAADVQAGLKC